MNEDIGFMVSVSDENETSFFWYRDYEDAKKFSLSMNDEGFYSYILSDDMVKKLLSATKSTKFLTITDKIN